MILYIKINLDFVAYNINSVVLILNYILYDLGNHLTRKLIDNVSTLTPNIFSSNKKKGNHVAGCGN